jgi:RimJ/RimL family protein N-acetyltransferase
MGPMERLEMWPLFGLKVTTPRVTMRSVDPDLAYELASLAASGIHDPAYMPFYIPWTDLPSPDLERGALRYYFRTWGELSPERWSIPLAVFEGGQLVGMQDFKTHDFATLRTFSTGSWLGQRFQGRGIGKEMRAAALHLGFAGFDAVRAETDAYADNTASLAVTRSLGYETNGSRWELRRGEPAEYLRFTMDRTHWEKIRRDDIVIEGLDERLRSFLGLDG